MNNFFIGEYSFNETGRVAVENEKYGKDWPVVYLIHNDKRKLISVTICDERAKNVMNGIPPLLN